VEHVPTYQSRTAATCTHNTLYQAHDTERKYFPLSPSLTDVHTEPLS
jgi:hypothetical protein